MLLWRLLPGPVDPVCRGGINVLRSGPARWDVVGAQLWGSFSGLAGAWERITQASPKWQFAVVTPAGGKVCGRADLTICCRLVLVGHALFSGWEASQSIQPL